MPKTVNLDKKELDKYIKDGMSLVEIAKILQCSRNTIRKYIQEYGLLFESKNQYVNLVGKQIGSFIVIEKVHVDKNRLCVWKCECIECKTTILRTTSYLKYANKYKCRTCYDISRRTSGNIPSFYWSNIKCRASKKKLEFSITPEYAWNIFKQQKARCNLSGRMICMNHVSKNYRTQTASLDRIDSSKGYVEGNIQWLHKDVNKMKMNLSQDNFLKICEEIYNYNSLIYQNSKG